MVRSILLSTLGLAGCLALAGCVERLPVTPGGTTLFEWDLSRATRSAVRTAKIGPRTATDKKLVITEGDAPFTVDLHLETAEIDFEEAGQKVHQIAPVLLRAKVAANDKWSLSGKCLDGPNYKMPAAGPGGELVTPLGMVQDCSIRHHRNAGLIFKSSYELGLMMQIHADGTITALPPERLRVE